MAKSTAAKGRGKGNKTPSVLKKPNTVEKQGRDTPPDRAAKRGVSKPGRDATPRDSIVYMTSTRAQNGFGRMLDTVAHGGTVLITRQNTTQAVVMSVERYEALTRGPASDLDTLTAEFDDLLRRLQSPTARARLRDAFRASPDELSQAAVAATRQA
ncbi:MAG TPA: type II toxin-antitoxin system prevent-host-death family antitoxin [Longimicrobiaceae bacterium]|nr:type II toxin-antitoxin system prevent-host-death family antitoxin [Longimicrobiaceae bacterium]